MPQLESNLAPAPQPESNPAPAPMTQPRAAAPWRPELAPPRAPAPRPIDKPSVQRRTNAPGGVVHRDPVEFVPRDPQGELDMSIVRQYIRRSEAKIRYCYEAQLLANPTLAGTVQTHFAIASSGAVASATATGLDGQVASCVAEVIKAIVFPSSESGAQIKYPFHFVKSEW
jgi:hypothetical protein